MQPRVQLPHSNSLVDRHIIAPIGLVNFHLRTSAFVLLILILSFTPYSLRTFSHIKLLAPNKSRFLILITLPSSRHEGAPYFKNIKNICAPHVSASFQSITPVSLIVSIFKYLKQILLLRISRTFSITIKK